jgi:hypothetical protein
MTNLAVEISDVDEDEVNVHSLKVPLLTKCLNADTSPYTSHTNKDMANNLLRPARNERRPTYLPFKMVNSSPANATRIDIPGQVVLGGVD